MTTIPTHPNSEDSEGRRALVRSLTNMLNQAERHHRHAMVSQEDLAGLIEANQHRADVGIGEVLKMLMISEEERQVDRQLLQKIATHLDLNDHLVIPRDQSTADAKDDFFD